MVRKKLIEEIKKEMRPQAVINKLSRTFGVLGDPTRTRIIIALSGKRELCVIELSKILDMSHSAISHQMRALKDLDLVRFRREGQRTFYMLDDRHINNLVTEGLKHVLEQEG